MNQIGSLLKVTNASIMSQLCTDLIGVTIKYINRAIRDRLIAKYLKNDRAVTNVAVQFTVLEKATFQI